METDIRLAHQALQTYLEQLTYSRQLSESVHIQQLADPADMTQEASARDVAAQILDRESALVRRIRSAMDRISEGSYGICLECEDEIAPKRLKAVPWAELCINCQERADRSMTGSRSNADFSEESEAA